MANIYLVIPAYNEEQAIGKVIRELRAEYGKIIVVDDGSKDATYDVAVREGATALRHLINRGQGAALQTGIQYALLQGAECIVMFDADGQHSASDIPRLVAPIERREADIVLGSRFLEPQLRREIPLGRKLVLKLGLFHQWIFSGLKMPRLP
jgi:glycosyltransferase involved in cell wall biosynthesis